MKHSARTFQIKCLAFIMILAVWGCGDDDEPPVNPCADKITCLAGTTGNTWKIASIEGLDELDDCLTTIRTTYNPDGSYIYVNGNDESGDPCSGRSNYEGQYTISGSVVTVDPGYVSDDDTSPSALTILFINETRMTTRGPSPVGELTANWVLE